MMQACSGAHAELRTVNTAAAVTALATLVVAVVAAACGVTCGEDARERGMSESEVEVYCELVRIIDDADISWTVRANLFDCLPGMTGEERDSFLDQLESEPDADLPLALQSLSTSPACDREE